jgi:hypothetical protein
LYWRGFDLFEGTKKKGKTKQGNKDTKENRRTVKYVGFGYYVSLHGCVARVVELFKLESKV